MLQVKHVNKYIDQRHILNDISFDMTQQCLLICGESGCGKSTLARIITGLDNEYTGQIYFEDKLKEQTPLKTWMQHIQYVPQYQKDTLDGRKTVQYTLMEPLKNYNFEKSSYQTRIDSVLERCLLPKDILKQRVETLSGGQFQRLWIAKALLVEPKVLILDEATTNLDVINEELIIEMLKSLKDTQLIIISHDSYVLNYFDGQMLNLNNYSHE
ncbi:ATP-binding cassette domain-containing protein [Staphylococcus caledonicus]|uniref:ABC transporter ATP-binding protein n=1 Tax=Staphylococcus sp. acrmy TaxID=2929076 RepID=UPI001F59230D|nr:ATP-binding cassette domain-containing protein [Staphylococcus sp. acrmy]MCI2947136.1 ATP-binding cassette domain-containing protein [Staphylococcus sp. acrmy]